MNQVERFIAQHPTLYHMAEFGSWPRIQEHGLLSVAALLDMFGVGGVKRHELYSKWRGPKGRILRHSDHGRAIVRDQHPMPPDRLQKVLLDGLTSSHWYEILNRKCFFWVDEERLRRMLNAEPYKSKKHHVLTLSTRLLLERDSERITISHINSGTVQRGTGLRGRDTFHPIQNCCIAGRKSGIAELTVERCVPNIEEVAVSVEVRKGNKTLETVWQR